MNPARLDDILIANPDAADADVPGLYREALKIARSAHVTATTLGDIWGAVRAATVRAQLVGAGDPLSVYVVAILSGDGFDPQNPQSVALLAQFVAGKLITQDEADACRWVFPTDLPTAEDIKVARPRAARKAAANALYRHLLTANAAVNQIVGAFAAGTADEPTRDQLIAAYTAAYDAVQ
jgi:hypothetical protein